MEGVAAPALVVRGRRDRLYDEPFSELLAARAGSGRRLTLPGGHNTPFTHPFATAAAWRSALS
jgi:pimeloyl-ACP methyl ester carboxylesterase